MIIKGFDTVTGTRISGLAKIKKCRIDASGCKLDFDGLEFSAGQYEKLGRIIRDCETITVAIEQVQTEDNIE